MAFARVVAVAVLFALVQLPLLAGTADAQPSQFRAVTPAPGAILQLGVVEDGGVEVAVDGPAGYGYLGLESGRGTQLDPEGDLLTEMSPGRYEGWIEPIDGFEAGTYGWRVSANAYDPVTFEETSVVSPTWTFTVAPPYRAPRLKIAVDHRQATGRAFEAEMSYEARSGPPSASILWTRRFGACPASPQAQAGHADPGRGSKAATVRVRTRRTGRLSICAYAVHAGAVVARATTQVTVRRAPLAARTLARWAISPTGFGRLRVGMTPRRVRQLTGRRMVSQYGFGRSCRMWKLAGAPAGLAVMTAYGRVVRFDAFRGRYTTSRGIRIGSSEARVRRRYGGVRQTRHPYTNGKYLHVRSKRGKMIFETNARGKVTSFRGGRAREVGYIEGCA